MSDVAERFLMSDNTHQFANNFFNNIDTITEDDNQERWSKGNK